MRLIDADATKLAICRDECGEDAESCDRKFCNFPSIIDEQQTVDAVPIEPIAKWLAGYAPPPIGINAHKAVEADFFGIRAGVWEEFLRGMDWEEEE